MSGWGLVGWISVIVYLVFFFWLGSLVLGLIGNWVGCVGVIGWVVVGLGFLVIVGSCFFWCGCVLVWWVCRGCYSFCGFWLVLLGLFWLGGGLDYFLRLWNGSNCWWVVWNFWFCCDWIGLFRWYGCVLFWLWCIYWWWLGCGSLVWWCVLLVFVYVRFFVGNWSWCGKLVWYSWVGWFGGCLRVGKFVCCVFSWIGCVGIIVVFCWIICCCVIGGRFSNRYGWYCVLWSSCVLMVGFFISWFWCVWVVKWILVYCDRRVCVVVFVRVRVCLVVIVDVVVILLYWCLG